METKKCPIIKSECKKEQCIGYCSLLKSKIFNKKIEIKRCLCCKNILFPYGDTFVHLIEDKNCKYSQVQAIEIRNTEKFFDEDLGTPTYTLKELMEELTTQPKNIFVRALNWLKRVQKQNDAIR